MEPLLTALPSLNLDEIDWVIVGGESGPGARIMNEDWVINIQDQCEHLNIPFFFKQWGGKNKKATGSLLNGKHFKQVPNISTVLNDKQIAEPYL